METISTATLAQVISQALLEDIGSGDVTTTALIAPDACLKAAFVARQPGCLSGLPAVTEVFRQLDQSTHLNCLLAEGADFAAGTQLAIISGRAAPILTGERLALNLLQHLSAIATLTHQFVQAVSGTKAQILDTRKTTPGLRELEKYAVRCGGGHNHRLGLYDMILIKDNHLALYTEHSLADAVQRARSSYPHLPLEIEVDTIAQLMQILPAEPDFVLLDNFTPEEIVQALQAAREFCTDHNLQLPQFEASGRVNLQTVATIAATGIDRISIGALTNNCATLDIGLDFLQ